MPTLSREHRRLLETTVAQARAIAEEGARKVLRDQYAVHNHEPWPHMTADDRKLRNQLRAHGRQLGDKRDPKLKTQGIEHLIQACAYEHWHRMLFARFLAENDLLLDGQHGVSMSLDEVRELAREQARDWMDVAAELAQRMLLRVFSPDDPVLKIQFLPETRQYLEEKLTALPEQVFEADDSLGWVYQFWQRDEKDRVNRAELKIGADELPAVTQLFTEDYMVLFLLENTLGAWWTAKRRAEGKDSKLTGYQWTYLRLNEDGSPAAGKFEGWPRATRDLRMLDPCMGSGRFLVFALPIIARMRMAEDGLPPKEAFWAVLKENLFGLEIDARCSQIAAFNLALAAWRLAGEHFDLPEMNLACSGVGINASEADWVKFAGNDYVVEQWLRRLYSLFRDAPTLGSLIDPTRYLESGQEAGFDRVLPLIEQALQREHSEEGHELAIAAQGVLSAFRILSGRFTLVATNVPYLGRGKQDPTLAEYCAESHSDAKADLATCFVDRCLRFCRERGSAALVTPQNWLFLTSYKNLRERLLKSKHWDFVARLGEHAFESPAAAGAFVALVGLTPGVPLNVALPGINHHPSTDHFTGWDVGELKTPDQKAAALANRLWTSTSQEEQLTNPDSRIILEAANNTNLLRDYASALAGQLVGDSARFEREFWEIDHVDEDWEFLQSTVEATTAHGGRSGIIFWQKGQGEMYTLAQSVRHLNHVAQNWLRGKPNWGKRGVVVSQMRSLPATIYLGQIYDCNCCAIIPNRAEDLEAIWAYCSSKEFSRNVRQLDQKMNVAPHTLLKVPFDLSYWSVKAKEQFPQGLPLPYSEDPTQWIAVGSPMVSLHPLQVAIARLIGYRWPRQTGSTFMDCPSVGSDGLEKYADSDGIVPLNGIAGAASAADRLRTLLAEAYGRQWSAAKLQGLLGQSDSLEDWLRNGFFEEHCRIFHQRPFVWHVWDGRKDGFHAFLNYHKLVAPNGEGRQTLEKLIYTYLGRWIERQTDDIRGGKDGADARLTAATHLKAELEKILRGENPYDIFVRWKPLQRQPIGWEPDMNDGVRLNIRPWVTAQVHQPSRRDGCILRITPRIPYGKDRGKEPDLPKEAFPWFWAWDGHSDDFKGNDKFDGARWNDLHYSLAKKKEAREKQSSAAGSTERGKNR